MLSIYQEECIAKSLSGIKVDSLKQVSGIGDGKIETLKEYGYETIEDFSEDPELIRDFPGFGCCKTGSERRSHCPVADGLKSPSP